ncbi:MAG: hypothetical protein JO353_13900 [Phycisphaerae bacterium]|nr:hypothetical protein [Phycisphaerae bacterium]
MKSTTKLSIAAAAMAGLFAGSASRAAAIATPTTPGVATASAAIRSAIFAKAGVRMLDDSTTQPAKHDCAGKNSCKGQGGCKTGDNGCKAKNSCKGKGGCSTMDK